MTRALHLAIVAVAVFSATIASAPSAKCRVDAVLFSPNSDHAVWLFDRADDALAYERQPTYERAARLVQRANLLPPAERAKVRDCSSKDVVYVDVEMGGRTVSGWVQRSDVKFGAPSSP